MCMYVHLLERNKKRSLSDVITTTYITEYIKSIIKFVIQVEYMPINPICIVPWKNSAQKSFMQNACMDYNQATYIKRHVNILKNQPERNSYEQSRTKESTTLNILISYHLIRILYLSAKHLKQILYFLCKYWNICRRTASRNS